jgi:hypothetical protein
MARRRMLSVGFKLGRIFNKGDHSKFNLERLTATAARHKLISSQLTMWMGASLLSGVIR